MKRFVYSPKVNAYIKVTPPDADPADASKTQIIDVSPYIVRGSVVRRIDQVSSASLELRNPHKIWTASTLTGGRPVFRPMDPITIVLTRVRNRPVQVFTGYLDASPYLQLYPGVVKLRASCTLKRILHTYWDPRLPFTFEFLKAYGWEGNDATGQLIKPEAEQPEITQQPLNDGSIGDLLAGVLEHVGGWDQKHIYIHPLPKKIVPRVVELYEEFVPDNEAAKKELDELLARMIGQGSYGEGGGEYAPTGPIKGAKKVVNAIAEIADEFGIPPAFVLAVALLESAGTLDPTIIGGAGNGYEGLYQMNMNGVPYGNAGISGGTTKKERTDVGISTALFCRAADHWRDKDARFEKESNWWKWAARTQGVVYFGNGENDPFTFGSFIGAGNERHFRDLASRVVTAKSLLSKYRKRDDETTRESERDSDSSAAPSHPSSPDAADRNREAREEQGGNKKRSKKEATSTDEIIWPTKARGINSPFGPRSSPGGVGSTNHQGVDINAGEGDKIFAALDGKVVTAGAVGGYGNFVEIDHGGGFKTGYAHMSRIGVSKGQSVQQSDVIGRVGSTGNVTGAHLHFETTINGSKVDPMKYLNGAPLPSGDPGDSGGGGTAPGGDEFSGAKAVAFSHMLNLPGTLSTAEAIGLQGQKSLMNDESLFPFVQQLSQASLRSFMSMPNGNFFAFYPDYFGGLEATTPYWEINDIEILDGNIDLNDDALATHVYVVGDSNFNNEIEQVDRLNSGGVVNIFNAFRANFLNRADNDQGEPRNEAEKRDRDRDKEEAHSEAVRFLGRYGARPYLQEVPFVRTPYFEAFLAFQTFCRMWAKQFATEFSFTFMPELYPGGLVAFPDHGIQCFIEEVTHNFDYEGGFTTNATLSAPAAYKNPNNKHLNEGMVRGFAL